MDNFIKYILYPKDKIRNNAEYLPLTLDKTEPKRAKKKNL